MNRQKRVLHFAHIDNLGIPLTRRDVTPHIERFMVKHGKRRYTQFLALYITYGDT